jgi:hypothetical protein
MTVTTEARPIARANIIQEQLERSPPFFVNLDQHHLAVQFDVFVEAQFRLRFHLASLPR